MEGDLRISLREHRELISEMLEDLIAKSDEIFYCNIWENVCVDDGAMREFKDKWEIK